MRAIRFEAFGDPLALELVDVPAPATDATTALVRVMAASLNPSDVKNVAGAMKERCGLGEAHAVYRMVAAGPPGRIVLRPQA